MWSGVFPAVTTQFAADLKVDYAATQRVISTLVKDGVSGLVVCGTVGENCSLTRAEKVGVMEARRRRRSRAGHRRHRGIHDGVRL
jgi:4-hydroxy-tetrahydrodipicolinate synthase